VLPAPRPEVALRGPPANGRDPFGIMARGAGALIRRSLTSG